jgi:osmotically-inducible protein OsmY
MSRLLTFAIGAAAGAAATHFLQPGRRNQIRDQAVSKVQAGANQAATTATHAAGKAKGAVAQATPSMPGSHRIEDVDDVTLARKVETEIFRAPDAPKGDVSVDVQAGVANLRGEIDEQWITRLGEEAEKVDGVKAVNNLLHPPGTPTPPAPPRGAITEQHSR